MRNNQGVEDISIIASYTSVQVTKEFKLTQNGRVNDMPFLNNNLPLKNISRLNSSRRFFFQTVGFFLIVDQGWHNQGLNKVNQGRLILAILPRFAKSGP